MSSSFSTLSLFSSLLRFSPFFSPLPRPKSTTFPSSSSRISLKLTYHQRSPSLPLSPTTRSNFGPAAMQISQIDSQLASANANTKKRITPNSPEAWKPVDEWEPLPLLRGSPEPSSSGLLVDTDSFNHSPGKHNDFRLIHAEVVKMASKSAAEILVTLETLWKNAAKKDVGYLLGDSAVVEELRRWMLSTMIHMDQVPTHENRVFPRRECLLTARMVVCLYDSAGKCRPLLHIEQNHTNVHVFGKLPLPISLHLNQRNNTITYRLWRHQKMICLTTFG